MDNKPSTELYFVLLACKKEKPSKFVFKCNKKENEVYFYKGETSWEILFDPYLKVTSSLYFLLPGI